MRQEKSREWVVRGGEGGGVPRRILTWVLATLFVVVGGVCAEPAREILVDDGFEDGSVERGGPLELDWVSVRYARQVAVGPVPGETNDTEMALLVRPFKAHCTMAGLIRTNFGNAALSSPLISLSDTAGDQYELTLDFKLLENRDPAKAQLRLGVFNHSGTTDLASFNGDAFTDDKGYGVILNLSGGKPWAFKKHGGAGSLCGGGDQAGLSQESAVAAPPLGAERHQLTLAIARATNGVSISAYLDGTHVLTSIDTTETDSEKDRPGVVSAFHAIGYSVGSSASCDVLIDNVKLVHISPPPPELNVRKIGIIGGTLVIVAVIWVVVAWRFRVLRRLAPETESS